MKTSSVVLLAFAVPAFAQGPAGGETPPPPPKPAPEMAQFKSMEGKWKCKAKAPASPAGPAHDYEANLEVKAALGGFWLTEHYAQMKTKVHPMAQAFDAYITYDPASKRFQRIGADNIGAWESATSPGWEENKLVWTGELANFMGQAKLPYRFTITKKSDREVQVVFEGPLGPNGQYVPLADESCRK